MEPLYLDLKRASAHTGLTIRWLRRYWPTLLCEGVKVVRLPAPKDQDKGKIMFERVSLEQWLEKRQVANIVSDSPR